MSRQLGNAIPYVKKAILDAKHKNSLNQPKKTQIIDFVKNKAETGDVDFFNDLCAEGTNTIYPLNFNLNIKPENEQRLCEEKGNSNTFQNNAENKNKTSNYESQSKGVKNDPAHENGLKNYPSDAKGVDNYSPQSNGVTNYPSEEKDDKKAVPNVNSTTAEIEEYLKNYSSKPMSAEAIIILEPLLHELKNRDQDLKIMKDLTIRINNFKSTYCKNYSKDCIGKNSVYCVNAAKICTAGAGGKKKSKKAKKSKKSKKSRKTRKSKKAKKTAKK